ncbi:MAG TPA: DUF11 domain-containing protein [Streptosporangiaceae bacterium]|nr:DUF11 domain-containing protein [Streptosporangiaceae bacterium]
MNGPGLSIGVDDGRQFAKPGDLLTYTVKIQNIGSTNARGLDVVQTLPAGMTLISASKHGAAQAGQVRWQLNLPAGHADTFGVIGKVGHTPSQLLRLATIACASTGTGVKPLVCAAHSDELPAGAAAAADARDAAGAAADSRGIGFLLPTGVTLLLAAAAITGWLFLRRRARRAS